jgi:serine/threonine protein kinase
MVSHHAPARRRRRIDVEGQAIQPGSILAGRYRIDDLVGEAAGSTTWRAFDKILNRSVSIRALAADDPRCEAFLDAARRSTAVSDPRFLPVLDAVPDEDGIAYVVREWTRGLPLSVLLREGPLPSKRAATIVGEVAEALAQAHDAGMPHRAINPSTVLIKDTGAVRITGLGTEHALRAAAPAPDPEAADDPNLDTATRQAGEQVDVRALGRVLYACLVARWPGGRGFGLPPAPTEHGRLLRPRQVRAGVSREADHVCDRVLGQPPRHHAPALTTPRDIADELTRVEDEESLLDDSQGTGEIGLLPIAAGNGDPVGPPALLPTRPRPAPKPRQPTRLERSREMARQATEGHRKLIWLGIVLLVALATVVAFVVGRQSAEEVPLTDGSSADSAGLGGVVEEELAIKGIADFDPLGDDGEENSEEAALTVDGKADTYWYTSYYESPDFGNYKPGVGLRVDLGSAQEVTGVEIFFDTAPTTYELYTIPPGATEPPSAAPTETDDWIAQSEAQQGDLESEYQLTTPVTTRYVLLWLTRLPPEPGVEGHWRGFVNELTIKGPAT